MFFQEKIESFKKDTIIPNIFFEQILPIVNPIMLKIYLYAYYLSQNEDASENFKINSNEALAEKLEVSLDDILACWDFFESCGLITKHRINEEQAHLFSVEFKNLKDIGLKKSPKSISSEELLVAYQNEDYRKMYDQIEQITQLPLMHHDMKKINEFIQQYNLPKELIVEAVKFNLYRKKSKSMDSALGVLRNWYLDGVRSSEDLDTMLKQKEKRYVEYKRILSNFGEYRLPTKPEEEMMDMWLDEYKFSIEVIENALKKTTSIKSPNMNYLNGILKNWHEKVKENAIKDLEQGKVTVDEPKEDKQEYRAKILRFINFTQKTMTKKEVDALDFLYENYHSEDVLLAIKWLRERTIPITLNNICKMLVDPSMNEDDKIGMEEINKIETKSPIKKRGQDASKAKGSEAGEMDELERKLQKRLFEKLSQRGNN